MATQKAIAENILRIAESLSDSEFEGSRQKIDGYSTSFVSPFFVRLYLDPWMRNNTPLHDAYSVREGEWRYNLPRSIQETLDIGGEFPSVALRPAFVKNMKRIIDSLDEVAV